MKRYVISFTIVAFIACLGLGYFSTRNQLSEQSETGLENFLPSIPATNNKNKLNKDGVIIYQYYYTKDQITKEQEEPVPDYLVGLSREDLQEIYGGWQIVSFSAEKAILRCTVEGRSDEVYLLSAHNGYLAVYMENFSKKMKLKEITNVPVRILPEDERMQLEEGIYILGEENLVKILSDFTS